MFDFFDSICVTRRDQEDLATSVNENLETLKNIIQQDAGLLPKMTHEAFLVSWSEDRPDLDTAASERPDHLWLHARPLAQPWPSLGQVQATMWLR